MEDILTVVYQYLSVTDINKCMRVNHQFYRAYKQPLVWSILLKQYYDNQYTDFKQNTLYDCYKKCHILNKLNVQLKIGVKDIIELNNLETLSLYYYQLTTIPSEISQLTNLQTLYLDNNQLTTIPSEIGQLTNLQELYLNNNQLTTIPSEIKQLKLLWYDFDKRL